MSFIVAYRLTEVSRGGVIYNGWEQASLVR